MPKKISRNVAELVLAALVQQHPAEESPFTLKSHFDDHDWVIVGESGPDEWAYSFPNGDEFGTPTVELPEGVWVEAINHYSIAILPK